MVTMSELERSNIKSEKIAFKKVDEPLLLSICIELTTISMTPHRVALHSRIVHVHLARNV